MSQITKRALEQSLKNLLLQKPLNKITISDITEDCGISRMTFYYHFKDIYDLVEWACMEDAKKALEDKKTLRYVAAGLCADFRRRAGKQALYNECLPLRQPGAGGKVPDAADGPSSDGRY